MSSQSERSLKIELNIKASQPELLEGLEALLRLGLISDAQVKQMSRQYLCCLLPEIPAIAPSSEPPVPIPTPLQSQVPEPSAAFSSQWAPEPPAKERPKERPSFLSRSLQSLMAELSVRWLLFLGVFMVAISSGLLAASQWEKFPAVVQYGVLLAYTLVFFAVSQWAALQPNLRLTAQTLQIVTLLLIPVNFWAMDGFRLWNNPLEWLTVAIATLSLTAITAILYKNSPQASRLNLLNNLGLSYLHWGWGFAGFPLIAVYIGTLITAIATLFQVQRRSLQKYALMGTAVVGYALAILLFRAIFVAGVAIAQLGFAIGICGWLFLRLSQQQTQSVGDYLEAGETAHLNNAQTSSQPYPWELLGGSLLILGWLVSVEKQPVQAIAVSGLGVWWFASRLRRLGQKIHLMAIFAIGLQSVWLAWRLIPPAIQTSAIATATHVFAIPEYASYSLLSLALFPYLLVTVWVADWLHRQQKTELANFGEQLALALGTFLTALSLISPSLRSLNLLASTLTLAVVTARRSPTRIFFVYLTHITGLLALTSTIDCNFPNLNVGAWASILLAIAVAEWLFFLLNSIAPNNNVPASVLNESIQTNRISMPLWRQSAWHLGFALAGLSYWLLWVNYSNSRLYPDINNPQWGIVWLIAPMCLAGIALMSEAKERRQASWLSVAGAIAAQFLTLPLPGWRLIGLGVATVLTFINTPILRQVSAAIVTVGLSLSFFFSILWEGIPGFLPLSSTGWLLAVGSTVAALWVLRSILLPRSHPIAAIYAPAIDFWAIALCGIELVFLTLHSLTVYWKLVNPSLGVIIATALIMGAIAYRGWQHPSNWAIYSFGWSLEVLTAEALGFTSRSVVYLAIANIVLGLIIQLIGDWWQRKTNRPNVINSLHVMPLLYGALGAALRWNTFANWTGLSSLGFALIAIGVGRRREEFKPLVYLAMFGVSLSAYEILLYQLSQTQGGAIGDGLIAMATLGTSIMYAYRVLTPWLIDYLRITRKELKIAAHLHWAFSSALLMATIATPIASAKFVGLGTGIFLIRYALFQGRHNPDLRAAQTWVYLGLLEAAGLRLYWLSTPIGLVFSGPLEAWKPATTCVGAYLLYLLPWEKWGWPKKPILVAAIVWPLVMMWESREIAHPLAFLIAAGFYLLLAITERQIRLTYISASIINWVLLRWFWNLNLSDTLAYIIPPALSLLYVAQVDPQLKTSEEKPTRHFLRVLGSGAICLGALFTSNWLVCGVLSLLAIFAGLTFRVRAFLYVGTVTFLLDAVNQLVILSQEYSFVKWIIGLLIGSAFIWIAASFETRRDRLVALVQNWIVELEEWQ